MIRGICLQILSLLLILVFTNCATSTNDKVAPLVNASNKSLRKTNDLHKVGSSESVDQSKEKTDPVLADPALLKINDSLNILSKSPSVHSKETKDLSSDSLESASPGDIILAEISSDESSDLNSTEGVSEIKSKFDLNAQPSSSEKISQAKEKITTVLTEPSVKKTEVPINPPKDNQDTNLKTTEHLNSDIQDSISLGKSVALNESLNNQSSDLNSSADKAEIKAHSVEGLNPIRDLTFPEQQKELTTKNSINDEAKGVLNTAENKEANHFLDKKKSNFPDLVKPKVSSALEESVNEARPVESYFSPNFGSDQDQKIKSLETDNVLVGETSSGQNLENQLIRSDSDNMENREVKIGFKDLNISKDPVVRLKKSSFSDKNELKPLGARNVNTSPEVFFNERVSKQSDGERFTDKKNIAISEKTVSVDSNEKNSFSKVGFRNLEGKTMAFEHGNSRDLQLKKSDNEGYEYGKLKTFLNRTDRSRDDKLSNSKKGFPLTENFLNTDTEVESNILPLRERAEKPSRYLKTLQWIETRGRTSKSADAK